MMQNFKLKIEDRFKQAGACTDIYSLLSLFVKNDKCIDDKSNNDEGDRQAKPFSSASSASEFWPELSIEQIGRIYAATIFFNVPENVWLSKWLVKRHQFDSIEAERLAKKEFQESTRISLYELVHALDKRHNPVEEHILDAYTANSGRIMISEAVTCTGTIEHRVKILAENDNFYAIGYCVLSGSKEYQEKKLETANQGINQKFKLFMEYD